MKDLFDLFGAYIPGTNIRRKPMCNTCKYQKLGLQTLCEQYKRIPSDVQQGKYCEKHLRNEVEYVSKFDYMNFSDGWDTEFVVHAKKFSKSQALDFFMVENKHLFSEGYRKSTISDIKERAVRWYSKVPEWCGYDGEGGCYGYCKREERGSFPVWVIVFKDLEVNK